MNFFLFRRANQVEIHNQFIGFQTRKAIPEQTAASSGAASDEEKKRKAVMFKKKTTSKKKGN